MGVEPTKDRLAAPPGFEVRTSHRGTHLLLSRAPKLGARCFATPSLGGLARRGGARQAAALLPTQDRSAGVDVSCAQQEMSMADYTYDSKVLNSLLATVIDSIDGFDQAN